MSTHAVGFRPPDERWKKMKEIWDVCTEARITVPVAVWEFFGHEKPEDAGLEVDLGSARKDFDDGSRVGYDIILSKLPDSIDRIRFYNSW